MQETSNFGLELYELDDMADLTDGYNKSMRTIDSAMQQIKDDAADMFPIDTADIANGAITEDKIATASITNTKLATGAVSLDKIAEGAIDDIPTQGSDNLITSDAVFDSISAVQVNGPYNELVSPVPFNTCKVLVAKNNSFYFLTGTITLTQGQTYSLPQIPGVSGSYGPKLTTNPIITAPASPMIYPNAVFEYATPQGGSSTFAGSRSLIIGTDGNLYLDLGINVSNYTPGSTRAIRWIQTKFTLSQLNLEQPISEDL